jgi:hypothetical protein
MNIMFEESINDAVKSKYILLELDTFYFVDIDKQKTSYCLIESAPIQELLFFEKNLELHKNLLKNYKLRNWKYCEDAIEHLMGCWNKELDSFYKNIANRISKFKTVDLDPGWNGIINRS